MIYRLLGDLEIGEPDRPLPLPRSHHLLVLVTLLLQANQRVAKQQLLRAGWGDAQIGEPQLPKAVSALRDALARIGRRGDIRTHSGFGYELRVPEGDLDMLVFRRLIRRAEAARGRSAEEEIGHLRAALALWRGPRALANVPDDAIATSARPLEQVRKRSAVRLFDLEIARGGHDRIVDQLTAMADHDPADRRLCEQLVIVLHRLGHFADAVGAYERHAEALERHTGAKPDPLLRTLVYAIAGDGDEAAVVQAEAALVRRAGTAGRTVVGPPAVPRQLPPEPAGFVGRENLLAEAAWLLGRPPARIPPVLVITGAGGMGKTALARLVAHRVNAHYPDGQLYVELRGTADGPAGTGEVLAQILRALGVSAVPETRAERLATYRTLLAARRVLVVLDDAADGAQVRDLVPAGPGCGVIVTTRSRLPELDGAHHLPPLESLEPGLAMALFRQTVAASGIELTAEADAVHDVVELCHGLPLALRVAGALRVREHPRPTAELAARLLRQGPAGFEYGQQSVARTIGAGYDRLGPGGRRLFLALGRVPLPSFALWTAAALLDGTGLDPAAALSELAASSMLEIQPAPARYRFHDLTREYALRRAQAEPGDEDAPQRAYHALLTLARRAHTALYGGAFEVTHSDVPDRPLPAEVLAEVDAAPLDWFERERLGIRAAVAHCADRGWVDLCWDLAVSSHEFYGVRGYFDDWVATHRTALTACRQAGDARGEGIVLTCLGQPALVASMPARGAVGLDDLHRAVRLLAECGDRHGLAIARRTLGNALRRRAQLAVPLRQFQDALAGYTAAGDTVGRWQTLRFIGQTYLDLGDTAAALERLREADDVAARLGDARLLAQNRYWIGQACLAAGDLDGARAACARVLEASPGPDGLGHAYALHGLGELALRSGDPADAEDCLVRAHTLAEGAADAVLEGRVGLSLAALAASRGRRDEQVSLLERAERRFADCGADHLRLRALAALARARTGWGEHEAAEALWGRVRDVYDQLAVPAQDRIEHPPVG